MERDSINIALRSIRVVNPTINIHSYHDGDADGYGDNRIGAGDFKKGTFDNDGTYNIDKKLFILSDLPTEIYYYEIEIPAPLSFTIRSGGVSGSIETLGIGGDMLTIDQWNQLPEGSIQFKLKVVGIISGSVYNHSITTRKEQYIPRHWRDLKGIEYDLSGSYNLIEDIYIPDPYFQVNGLTDAGFEPIGYDYENRNTYTYAGSPFRGELYSDTKAVIKNLYINRPDEYDLGLFAVIDSTAVIRGIGLEGVIIYGKASLGGLVGDNVGNISNSYSTTNVSGGSYTNNTGGLVGENDYLGVIRNSYATGNVTGNGNGFVGDSTAAVIDSYWDIEGTGHSNGGHSGATGVSSINNIIYNGISIIDSQNNQPLFTNWDFYDFFEADPDKPWILLEGQAWPTLYWQHF